MIRATVLVLTMLLAAAAPVAAAAGSAIVVDGDTLEIAGERIRLWGIDAPESRQTCQRDGELYTCGHAATDHLRALVGRREVQCVSRAKDRYGRTVAVCRVDGVDLGAVMVRDGWALAFTRYSKDYTSEERAAHEAKRGLWEGTFVSPWEWRADRQAPLR
jgi:endonuclease YncB( thermonuclease family)